MMRVNWQHVNINTPKGGVVAPEQGLTRCALGVAKKRKVCAPVGYVPTFNDGLGCSQVIAYSDESVGTDNVLWSCFVNRLRYSDAVFSSDRNAKGRPAPSRPIPMTDQVTVEEYD